FVTGAGSGACLAVLAGEESDVGLVAYEMNVLVEQVGRLLETFPRNGDQSTSNGHAPTIATRERLAATSDRHTPAETSDGPGSPVRPYVMMEGREGANTVQLDMISVVIAVRGEVDELSLEPEQLAILDLCHRTLSVAEVSARLDIPVAVVKVL